MTLELEIIIEIIISVIIAIMVAGMLSLIILNIFLALFDTHISLTFFYNFLFSQNYQGLSSHHSSW